MTFQRQDSVKPIVIISHTEIPQLDGWIKDYLGRNPPVSTEDAGHSVP